MFKLISEQGGARRGEFITNRGTVQTPAFMNVATAGAIKGAVSAEDLKQIGCQVMLSNTYHLHVRPGDEIVRACGGLITNFHLPESTLIMLVSAFAGYENTMSAYKTAVDEKYRFFSFGDAMLII